MTEPEKRLWQGCLKPLAKELSVRIYRQRPMLRYIVDFEIRDARVVVEVDGESHYLDEQARREDEVRDLELARFGYRVLRFTNKEIMENLEGVCQRIREVVLERKSSF